jgi:hypothetical protein
MKVLSLGWGVQSFTLAAMAALGELPKPDVCIHADTTHEFSLTYQFAKIFTPWLEERGLRIITVSSNVEVIINRGGGEIYIPSFTNTPSSQGGQLRRQCTGRWKIAPMRRWLQDNREGQPIEMWIGISTDEALRMRDSEVKYITNRWPLIEKHMSRKDCENYLLNHGLPIPAKSACTFCPYHSTKEWRIVKAHPRDWEEATEIDRAIRKVRPPYDLFVHPSRKPLEDVDFRTLEEMGQMRLWDEECTGMCGV